MHILTGNGSAPSSVKKKRRKKRAVADIPIEMTTVEHSKRSSRGESDPDINSSSHNNNNFIPDDEPSKNNYKYSRRSTNPHDDQVIESMEPAEEQKPTKRKKKKKKKNLETADSETNTSRFVDISDKRIKPPPRLAPIDPDVIQSSINRMATPPLRSKIPRETVTESELPPSGDSAARRARRKRLSEQPTSTAAEGMSYRLYAVLDIWCAKCWSTEALSSSICQLY